MLLEKPCFKLLANCVVDWQMIFLNLVSFSFRSTDANISKGTKLSAGFAGKCNSLYTARLCDLNRLNNVFGIS